MGFCSEPKSTIKQNKTKLNKAKDTNTNKIKI